MNKKWDEIEVINLRNKKFNEKVYKQMIEEVANVIYIELCQLQKKSLSDSSNVKDNLLKRTGLDA